MYRFYLLRYSQTPFMHFWSSRMVRNTTDLHCPFSQQSTLCNWIHFIHSINTIGVWHMRRNCIWVCCHAVKIALFSIVAAATAAVAAIEPAHFTISFVISISFFFCRTNSLPSKWHYIHSNQFAHTIISQTKPRRKHLRRNKWQ